jgi:hypothetical protein
MPLPLSGEIESSILVAASTIHSTMAYPELARLNDWAISTTVTATTPLLSRHNPSQGTYAYAIKHETGALF